MWRVGEYGGVVEHYAEQWTACMVLAAVTESAKPLSLDTTCRQLAKM